MTILELIVISISLAMDAFAVSICKGLTIKKITRKECIIIGLYFGVFQAIMPLIGYLLSKSFAVYITNIDHWLAFILLLFIGINMIMESLSNDNKDYNDKIDYKTMLPLSVATSIDALAVGITLAFFQTDIKIAILIIGIITFLLSLIGVKIGHSFGKKYQSKAQLLGGITLILIGLKILLEHLGIL